MKPWSLPYLANIARNLANIGADDGLVARYLGSKSRKVRNRPSALGRSRTNSDSFARKPSELRRHRCGMLLAMRVVTPESTGNDKERRPWLRTNAIRI
jgi:hypothetical protein